MYKMQQSVLESILLIGLFGVAWRDYKTKLIEIKWLFAIGILGILGIVASGDWKTVHQACAGTIIGVGILLYAGVTKESIGFGDGWLFVITGIYLGFIKNFILLLVSLFFSGIVSVCCLILKKVQRTERIAFAPFVLTAYVVLCL